MEQQSDNEPLVGFIKNDWTCIGSICIMTSPATGTNDMNERKKRIHSSLSRAQREAKKEHLP